MFENDRTANFNINDELKKLPRKPGVYLMKDKSGKIIYVGKAVNLSNRVKSYFFGGEKPARISRMVSQVRSFEYIAANDEREAFIIECNLIKSHMPYYNILLKDDKTYPYIRVSTAEEYPALSITRKYADDGARYFGPYPERVSAKKAMGILQTIFPVRTCRKKTMGKDTRPCLNYYIKRCPGPCAGLCTRDGYMVSVNGLLGFLDGRAPEIIEELKKKMDDASRDLRYEQAAVYRDSINTLRKASDIYMIKPGMKRSDVAACAAGDGLAVVYILNIENSAVTGHLQFEFDSSAETDAGLILRDFMRQYYSGRNMIPDEIIAYNEIENIDWLAEWISVNKGSKVSVKVPSRGEKKKLADMAGENARHVLSAYSERKNTDRSNLIELASLLELEVLPERIEAFDISNLSGRDTVGSMVVFEGGKAEKSRYRRFSVKQEAQGDDLKAMAEVVGRRIARINDGRFGIPPDLIMIDGGRNQVNAARAVLAEAGLDLPVCGMVKDDRHATRALIYEDHEYPLMKQAALFRFVASLQNEAHRFAIEFNRKKRKKRYFDSELDNIPGIGEKRKENLMKHFGSLREIRAAGISQLESAKGISNDLAAEIYAYFHGRNGQ
ncbi:MAG: excinuclease ABC subunit UvrC [Clostridia bacterium]